MLDKVKSALLTMQRYSWEQAVAALAFLEDGDEEIALGLVHDAIIRQSPDGRLGNIGGQNAVTDPIAILPVLAWAFENNVANGGKDEYWNILQFWHCNYTCMFEKLNSSFSDALKWILKDAPRNKDGIIYHMDNTKEFWVDSMYMLPPALLIAGNINIAMHENLVEQYNKDPEEFKRIYCGEDSWDLILYNGGYVDEAIKQADGYINALYDKEAKLFKHIWDDEGKKFVVNKHWGVGNGWAIAGLGRMIEALPDNKRDVKARYAKIIKDTCEAALQYEDDGMFPNFLTEELDPKASPLVNFPEINFAQMLCYTVYKGVYGGWLDKELLTKINPIRDKVHRRVDKYGYVFPVCGAPFFNKPGVAPEAQAFFILMEAAYKKYMQQ